MKPGMSSSSCRGVGKRAVKCGFLRKGDFSSWIYGKGGMILLSTHTCSLQVVIDIGFILQEGEFPPTRCLTRCLGGE